MTLIIVNESDTVIRKSSDELINAMENSAWGVSRDMYGVQICTPAVAIFL